MIGLGKTGPLSVLAKAGPAVTGFVMLSGFAIGTSLLNSRATYGQFMARRVARIYPIYFVGLVLMIAIAFVGQKLSRP